MDQFGSDKPDRRFQMYLTDLADVFATSSFKMFRGALDAGGVVKAINAKNFAALTVGQSNELTAMAKHYGAKGLAFIKIENGEWKSPLVKFFTAEEKAALGSKLQAEEGDLVLFTADKREIANEILGRIRLRIAEMQKLTEGSEALDFLWVTDFPLMAFDAAENKWNAVHHPFTRPKAEDVPLVDSGDFGKARAEAYDVVLNGVEIGGGSIRIHEPDLQAKMFAALGVNEEDQQSMFGHILRAFRLGAPPHGGIAMGLDRMVMLICGAASIREVMAFPKNNRGLDLRIGSPSLRKSTSKLRSSSLTTSSSSWKECWPPSSVLHAVLRSRRRFRG
jgi:aspartyl-tRNA synthetase